MVLMKLYMLLIQYFISVVQVAENFIPPLLDAVLLDYQRNVSAAREPEVLSTMATIVNRLEVQYQVLEIKISWPNAQGLMKIKTFWIVNSSFIIPNTCPQ